jgi:hypothetical protein
MLRASAVSLAFAIARRGSGVGDPPAGNPLQAASADATVATSTADSHPRNFLLIGT